MTTVNDLNYDVGMHNGNDTAFYLACGYRVVAIEADPTLAAAGTQRFQKEIASGQLTILNVGIGDQPGTATFWINEVQSTLNSFIREITAQYGEPHHPITIQCRRLDDIMREHGVPHYMKIDIEGHDIVCCDQLTNASKPRFISVEMSRVELLVKLRDLGYDRFKLITQLDHQCASMRNPSLYTRGMRRVYRLANYHKENRALSLRVTRTAAANALYLAEKLGLWGLKPFRSPRLPTWSFGEGASCSGSFGDELPGEWLGWEGAAYRALGVCAGGVGEERGGVCGTCEQ
jgi:FkbM family methyltransferase